MGWMSRGKESTWTASCHVFSPDESEGTEKGIFADCFGDLRHQNRKVAEDKDPAAPVEGIREEDAPLQKGPAMGLNHVPWRVDEVKDASALCSVGVGVNSAITVRLGLGVTAPQ